MKEPNIVEWLDHPTVELGFENVDVYEPATGLFHTETRATKLQVRVHNDMVEVVKHASHGSRYQFIAFPKDKIDEVMRLLTRTIHAPG